MNNTESINISRAGAITGEMHVPGDKSISHRVAMLAPIAHGRSCVSGFLESEDCLNTLNAMRKLGAEIRHENNNIIIEGRGAASLCSPESVLDLGNSGTGMRLLAGLLSGLPVNAEMTGDASLCSRPMGRIRNPLAEMGADIKLLGKGGCAPIRIQGGNLHPLEYKLPMASAQVKSAVLLAGLSADGETVVTEPRATRDHTERLLKAMGADINVEGLIIRLRGGSDAPPLHGGSWNIPGDFSSAAFWIVAAALTEGSRLAIHNVGLNPRRTALLDVLRRMGADIEIESSENNWEPAGTITIRGNARLRAAEVGGDEIPNLIDELPLVAIAGALAEGETIIRDAHELRVKESDRIATMAENLTKLGIAVSETDDGMRISGNNHIGGGVELESFGDHRVAMSMAILSLHADKPVTIRNTACIATSYPGFVETLHTLTDR